MPAMLRSELAAYFVHQHHIVLPQDDDGLTGAISPATRQKSADYCQQRNLW